MSGPPGILQKAGQILNRTPRRVRELVVRGGSTGAEISAEFIQQFFSSRREYNQYAEEFDRGPAVGLRNQGIERYRQLAGLDSFGGIGLDVTRAYYALVRKLQPEGIIETGVCNGVSTLGVLLALQENGSGTLHSIDYPFRTEESLNEFRAETFRGYGGAAIPSDKDPGWIIPDKLRPRWNLTVGKSQRELPQVVSDVDSFELFIHDSEHSHPCMMFEYELAHEWLQTGGVILSDDITWNKAFDVFTDARDVGYGQVSDGVGYVVK